MDVYTVSSSNTAAATEMEWVEDCGLEENNSMTTAAFRMSATAAADEEEEGPEIIDLKNGFQRTFVHAKVCICPADAKYDQKCKDFLGFLDYLCKKLSFRSCSLIKCPEYYIFGP